MSSELEDAKKNIENQILKLNEQVEEIKKKPKQNAHDKRRLIMFIKKVRQLDAQKKTIEKQINALEKSIRQSTIMTSNRPLSLAPSSARGPKVSKREGSSRRHYSTTPYITATQTVMNYCDELREESSNNDQFNRCYEDLYNKTIDIIADPSSDEEVINDAKLLLKKLIMQLDNNISEEDIDIDKIVDQIKERNYYASPQNSTSVRSPQKTKKYHTNSRSGLFIRSRLDNFLGEPRHNPPWRDMVGLGLKKAPYIITNKKKRKRQIKHSKRHKKYPKQTKRDLKKLIKK